MSAKRILIVEPDAALALSVAGVFRDDGCLTSVASSAGQAELEIATRRPDLAVVRAELPDLSGFSLCAHLRHDRATAGLPVVIYSSDTPPASLAEHARTPWAANGYLAMPLDTAALAALTRRLLAVEEEVESADDAVIEELPDAGQAPPAPAVAEAPGPAPAEAPPPGTSPPPVRRRPRREALTEEDRLFADRVFQSIADRRDELLVEAERRRPPPRRDLLGSPEGRVQLLRAELRWREAQIARLAEVWEAREREVASVDERIHARDVELERHRQSALDLGSRLEEARSRLAEQDRAHGASIEGLLLEKFKEEKELIEVVAGAERRLHELARELRGREEAVARLEGQLAEQTARAEAEAASGREARQQISALEGRLEGVEGALRAAEEKGAELQEAVTARDELLRTAGREVERVQGELSAARQALMLRESELRGEVARARSDADELAGLLAQATRERDDAAARAAGAGVDLSAARAEAGALAEALEVERRRVERLSADVTVAEPLPGRGPGDA
jgi:ParB family chromosome partitioning protein